jgi:RimJ/RimL family protein N-acetyltransferase
MILFGDVEHGRKISHKAGVGFDTEIDFCLSRITEKGELLGGVTYTNYAGRSVMAHIAGFHPRWMTPEFMWIMHDFPFNQLKVERILVTVPTTNERSMTIAQKMGFTWIATIPAVVVGGDLDVLSMSRITCKYLKLGWRYTALENAA